MPGRETLGRGWPFPRWGHFSAWLFTAAWSEDLACAACRGAGLMPTDGGGNLITLAARDDAI
jgi:hypothetical protein